MASLAAIGWIVVSCAALRESTSAPAASAGTGVRIPLTTTVSEAVASCRLTVISVCDETSTVSAAKPGANT